MSPPGADADLTIPPPEAQIQVPIETKSTHIEELPVRPREDSVTAPNEDESAKVDDRSTPLEPVTKEPSDEQPPADELAVQPVQELPEVQNKEQPTIPIDDVRASEEPVGAEVRASEEPVGAEVKAQNANRLDGPLKYSGSLDHYERFDVTPVIGEEFPKLQLSEILSDDDKIRDLAILVSQRGVVFFRNQDLGIDDQKILGQKLGELTGKPETSKLHRHALSNSKRGIAVDENGKLDDEVSVISSEQNRAYYKDRFGFNSKRLASEGWHADITFERIPSDYAILKIHTLPSGSGFSSGGDTLWASGYEAYDRLSPPWKAFAESLTATHHQPNFNRVAKEFGAELIEGDRGAPENSGLDFKASHPVVRTNPVTGWKSLFGAAHQVYAGHIDGVSETESEVIKNYFLQLIAENHDLQVRFRWGKNDLAIWDNRSVFHTATNDYEGKRQGNRVVSLGEKPFFDPKSVSRREALAATEKGLANEQERK